MAITTTATVDIGKSAEAIFDFSIDSQNFPAIHPPKGKRTGVVRAFSVDGGPCRPGAVRRIVQNDGEEFEQEYIAVDRPRFFHYRIRREATGLEKLLVKSIESKWTFAPIEGGTRVTWTSEHSLATPLGAPIILLYTRLFLRSLMQDSLDNLKRLMS